MKWGDILEFARRQPVIQTRLLLRGDESPEKLRVQLSRWVKAGKLVRLKRGYFVLPPKFATLRASEKFLAVYIYSPSYISLEYALASYGLIPEAAYTVTLVTTRRPGRIANDLFTAHYRHIKTSLFWGFESDEEGGQTYFIARPEKALLDLLYFSDAPITDAYLDELRLQNLDILDQDEFLLSAKKFKSKKIEAAAQKIIKRIADEREEFQTL